MEDYIKRKETRKHLFDRLIETAKNNTGYLSDASLVYQDAADRIRLWIDEIPAAGEVERKTGKWLPFEFGDERWHQCSVCGTADCYGTKHISFAGEKHIFFAVRNYCPICGAKMEN